MPALFSLVLFAVIATWFGYPRRMVKYAVASIWLVIVLVIAAFPSSAIAEAIGGDLGHWLIAGAVAALILGYRAALRRLRANVVEPDSNSKPVADNAMSDAELDRYARHLVLREIGGAGQMRLRDARVLIVGAGGLGSPLCLYLAAAGVGHITVADDDKVSLSNLQRQVIFRSNQRGESKVKAAADNMQTLNPHINVTEWPHRISTADVEMIAGFDLVIDGTDSFASRTEINRACVAAKTPLIAGAISQWEGQVTLYDPTRGGPCFSCLFPQAPADGLAPPCAEAGVVGALPGVIGSIMALEAIKHLTDAGAGLRGRMLIFDGLYGESRMIKIAAREDCPVCDH